MDNAKEAIALWADVAIAQSEALPNATTVDRQVAHVLQALSEDADASFIEVRLPRSTRASDLHL